VDAATGRGDLIGTLGYMSPEQLRGDNVDARSDLFSFGAMLYEVVSGRRAFKGNTTADTIKAILREDPADLTATTPDVPPMLERMVRHCLEKDPAASSPPATSPLIWSRCQVYLLRNRSRPLLLRKGGPGLFERCSALQRFCLVSEVGALRLTSAHRPAPTYLPLTFARESVNFARFTPDRHTVIYSSARVGGEEELFSVTPESLPRQSMLD